MKTQGVGRNVGLPSLLWHSAQLGRQSCQFHAPATLCPQGNKLLCTHFCLRLSGPQGYCMRTEEVVRLKISKDLVGNGTQNVPSCGAVPQQTAPHVPGYYRVPMCQASLLRPLWGLSSYECLRQIVEAKKFGRSAISVKESQPQGCASFCKLGCGTDSTRGHLSTFVRFWLRATSSLVRFLTAGCRRCKLLTSATYINLRWDLVQRVSSFWTVWNVVRN
jgi:hypothetical protein